MLWQNVMVSLAEQIGVPCTVLQFFYEFGTISQYKEKKEKKQMIIRKARRVSYSQIQE
jgi:hypothetical protein